MSTDIVHLSDARRMLEAATTPTEALTAANRFAAWDAAVRAADHSFEVQQEAAELRIRAERRLGQLLADTVTAGSRHTPEAQLPEGVSRDRSSRAQKLARIDDNDLDSFLANTRSAEKDLTITGALKLLPVNQRPDRSSIAAVYTAPPIDVELARRAGLDAADERADLFVAAIQQALNDLAVENPTHALVWARHHGIEDDGTIGDTWTFASIAASLGVTREVVEGRYYRASTHVYRHVAVAALNRVAELMAQR